MKPLINPIDKKLLEKELTADKFLRNTNKGNNRIYVFTYDEAPQLMLEVARLRELSFRDAGGGTGAELDIDNYDIMKSPYRQLIVWDPEAREIIGGYRYFFGRDALYREMGRPEISISDYFYLSNRFLNQYLPTSVELGRAFVQPDYQSGKMGSKSIFALDNLWDGLGALVAENPDVNYFFGKVTTYRHFNVEARNYILQFMHTWFPDFQELMLPIHNTTFRKQIVSPFSGFDFQRDYMMLKKLVKQLGENIPPLFNSYIGLSASLKILGSALNPHLGDVDETAILLTIKDIYPDKVHRYITSYKEEKLQKTVTTNAILAVENETGFVGIR